MRLSVSRWHVFSLLAGAALAILPRVALAAPAYSPWQQSLADSGPWLVPLMLIVIPSVGFGLIILIMMAGMYHLIGMQRQVMERGKSEEHAAQKRTRIALATALTGELTDNKIKCEAFITIYTELLRNLRDTGTKALYEETGDFIHQHPPLSRKVFDANVEKIALLGNKLASDVTGSYSGVRTEADYFTLETTTPRASAIRMIEMVLDNAQRILEPLESTIAALNMIIRDVGGKQQGGK